MYLMIISQNGSSDADEYVKHTKWFIYNIKITELYMWSHFYRDYMHMFISPLTYFGLMMLYGNKDLRQHWLR